MEFVLDQMASPIGTIQLVGDGAALIALVFADDDAWLGRHLGRYHAGYSLKPGRFARRERIEAYFAGALAALDDIEVRAEGTAFQHRVWAVLRTIPVGTTMSYGALAQAIGAPKASRAVGLANGANPVSVVVPCHRVIGANGTLTGYGGGIERKAWLLAHEGGQSSCSLPLPPYVLRHDSAPERPTGRRKPGQA